MSNTNKAVKSSILKKDGSKMMPSSVSSSSSTLPSGSTSTTTNKTTTTIITLAEQPKRPLSAYNYFFKSERARLLGLEQPTLVAQGCEATTDDEDHHHDDDGDDAEDVTLKLPKPKRRHRKVHGTISFRDMANQVGARWKSLSDEERAPYLKLFQQDRARYKAEMRAWNDKQKKRAKALVLKQKQQQLEQEKQQQDAAEQDKKKKVDDEVTPETVSSHSPPTKSTSSRASLTQDEAKKKGNVSRANPNTSANSKMRSCKEGSSNAAPVPVTPLTPKKVISFSSKKKSSINISSSGGGGGGTTTSASTSSSIVYDILADTQLKNKSQTKKNPNKKEPSFFKKTVSVQHTFESIVDASNMFYDITIDIGSDKKKSKKRETHHKKKEDDYKQAKEIERQMKDLQTKKDEVDLALQILNQDNIGFFSNQRSSHSKTTHVELPNMNHVYDTSILDICKMNVSSGDDSGDATSTTSSSNDEDDDDDDDVDDTAEDAVAVGADAQAQAHAQIQAQAAAAAASAQKLRLMKQRQEQKKQRKRLQEQKLHMQRLRHQQHQQQQFDAQLMMQQEHNYKQKELMQRKRKRMTPHEDLRHNPALNVNLSQFLCQEQNEGGAFICTNSTTAKGDEFDIYDDDPLQEEAKDAPILNEADFDDFFDRFDFADDDEDSSKNVNDDKPTRTYYDSSSNATSDDDEGSLNMSFETRKDDEQQVLHSNEIIKRLNRQLSAMQAAMQSMHRVMETGNHIQHHLQLHQPSQHQQHQMFGNANNPMFMTATTTAENLVPPSPPSKKIKMKHHHKASSCTKKIPLHEKTSVEKEHGHLTAPWTNFGNHDQSNNRLMKGTGDLMTTLPEEDTKDTTRDHLAMSSSPAKTRHWRQQRNQQFLRTVSESFVSTSFTTRNSSTRPTSTESSTSNSMSFASCSQDHDDDDDSSTCSITSVNGEKKLPPMDDLIIDGNSSSTIWDTFPLPEPQQVLEDLDINPTGCDMNYFFERDNGNSEVDDGFNHYC